MYIYVRYVSTCMRTSREAHTKNQSCIRLLQPCLQGFHHLVKHVTTLSQSCEKFKFNFLYQYQEYSCWYYMGKTFEAVA